MSWGALAGIIFVGLGPEGAGYLMWELALHRAAASTLGLLGSATPVLSTLWLLAMFASTADGKTQPDMSKLLAGAFLIGVSVLIGTLGPRAKPEERRVKSE